MVKVNGKYNYGNENQCDTSERMTQKNRYSQLKHPNLKQYQIRYIGR